MAACRPPPRTTETLPPGTPASAAPHPRSPDPPRWPPENCRRSSRWAAPGRASAARPAASDQNAVSSPSSQPPPAGCRGDRSRRPTRAAGLRGARCEGAGGRPSMGFVGDALHDAMRESFFATLEGAMIDRRRFRSRPEARMAAFYFIEGRLHRGTASSRNGAIRHAATRRGCRSPIGFKARLHDMNKRAQAPCRPPLGQIRRRDAPACASFGTRSLGTTGERRSRSPRLCRPPRRAEQETLSMLTYVQWGLGPRAAPPGPRKARAHRARASRRRSAPKAPRAAHASAGSARRRCRGRTTSSGAADFVGGGRLRRGRPTSS